MSKTGRAGGVLTLCMTAVFVTIGSSPAGAEPIRLTVLTGPSIQQTENRPCVIGDPSCHNPDFLPYTLIAPQNEDGTLTSPEYTVGQIRNVVGGDDSSWPGSQSGQRAGGRRLHAGVLQPLGRRNDALFHERTGESRSPQLRERLLGCNHRHVQPGRIVRRSEVVFTASFSGGSAGREQFFLSPQPNDGPGNPIRNPRRCFWSDRV